MTTELLKAIPKNLQATGTACSYDDRDDVLREEIERQRAEARAKQADKLWEASNVGKRFKHANFNAYTGDLGAKKACMLWADTYSDGKGLVLCGSYGTGKTHLAIATAKAVLETYRKRVWIDTFAGMLQELKSAYSQPTEFTKAMNKYKEVELLVIDDLGKENLTAWGSETLFSVIDSRYRDMKSLIVTTNLLPNDLSKHIDGAILSRLAEMCEFVQVKGEDYRLKMKGAK